MKSTARNAKDNPILLFKDQKAWTAWLSKNHAVRAAPSAVWLRIAKKGAEVKSLSYDEAVEGALCYGWIDGQKKAYDESTWLQRFTPRGPKSGWSKINRQKAEDLIARGKMKPAGLKAVEGAKQDGRWAAAYDSARTATLPDDFQAELDKNDKAKAFFATLNSANRYAILYRIQTAKKIETRAKRIQQFIAMLERNETIYP
jgi:uncharacterized protein YdeI (YjbR/CyaY-like superfamily)